VRFNMTTTTTTNRRILKESAATLEVAIAKCLSQGELNPTELEEIAALTTEELMSKHELDHLLAEKIRVHVQTEIQRHSYQGQMTQDIESRDSYGSMTRTHPIPESVDKKTNVLAEVSDFKLEDIMDLEGKPPESHDHDQHDHADNDDGNGRMLDYGHTKSDSREGEMARQALYELSEYSKELHELLEDDDDLPQWCHYKIAVARACVGKVKHYLEYKLKKHTGEIQ
jgi:hypothetical protein